MEHLREIIIAVALVQSVGSGFLTATVAASKYRDPLGWFLVGLFLPLAGLIALLGLPTLRED